MLSNMRHPAFLEAMQVPQLLPTVITAEAPKATASSPADLLGAHVGLTLA